MMYPLDSASEITHGSHAWDVVSNLKSMLREGLVAHLSVQWTLE